MIDLATIGIQIETVAGRVEAGRDSYSIPFLRDTITGVITNGSHPVYTDEELRFCAADWDKRLDEGDAA